MARNPGHREEIENEEQLNILLNYDKAKLLVKQNSSKTFIDQLTELKNEMKPRLLLPNDNICISRKDELINSNKKLEEMRKILTDSQYKGQQLLDKFVYNLFCAEDTALDITSAHQNFLRMNLVVDNSEEKLRDFMLSELSKSAYEQWKRAIQTIQPHAENQSNRKRRKEVLQDLENFYYTQFFETDRDISLNTLFKNIRNRYVTNKGRKVDIDEDTVLKVYISALMGPHNHLDDYEEFRHLDLNSRLQMQSLSYAFVKFALDDTLIFPIGNEVGTAEFIILIGALNEIRNGVSHEHLFDNCQLANDKKYLQDLLGLLERRLRAHKKSDQVQCLDHQLQRLGLRLEQLQERRRGLQYEGKILQEDPQRERSVQQEEENEKTNLEKHLEDRKNEKPQADIAEEKKRKKLVNISSPDTTYESSLILKDILEEDKAQLEVDIKGIEDNYRQLKDVIFSEQVKLDRLLRQTQSEQRQMLTTGKHYQVEDAKRRLTTGESYQAENAKRRLTTGEIYQVQDTKRRMIQNEFLILQQLDEELNQLKYIENEQLPKGYSSQTSSYRKFLQEFRIDEVIKILEDPDPQAGMNSQPNGIEIIYPRPARKKSTGRDYSAEEDHLKSLLDILEEICKELNEKGADTDALMRKLLRLLPEYKKVFYNRYRREDKRVKGCQDGKIQVAKRRRTTGDMYLQYAKKRRV